MKLNKKLDKLIPFFQTLDVPLWEEGNYTPFITFWQIHDTIRLHNKFMTRAGKLLLKHKYEIVLEDQNLNNDPSGIYHYVIYPQFNYLKSGGYSYKNKTWSIEEMIDLLIEIICTNDK